MASNNILPTVVWREQQQQPLIFFLDTHKKQEMAKQKLRGEDTENKSAIT